MRPIFQRIVCKDRGDCQAACIASILGIPYAMVPQFIADAFDLGQPHRGPMAIDDWLRALGYHLRVIPWKELHDWRGLDGQLVILSVPSQRFPGVSHAVVGTWEADGAANRLRIVHDPNPSNVPYPDDVEPTRVGFLIPRGYQMPAVDVIVHAEKQARGILDAPVIA